MSHEKLGFKHNPAIYSKNFLVTKFLVTAPSALLRPRKDYFEIVSKARLKGQCK